MVKNLHKYRAIKASLFLIILALMLQWLLGYSATFRNLEARFQDQLVVQRASNQSASTDIVVIDIDDSSIIALADVVGKWPWPRSVHAELLEFLNTQKPHAVVFDILFSEADLYRPDSDSYFNEVIEASHNVYLAMASQTTLSAQNTPLLVTYPKELGLEKMESARADSRALLLLPNAISKQAWRLGSIDFSPDGDGVGRRYALYQEYDGWRMPSLPAKVAKDLGYMLPESAMITLDWQSTNIVPHERYSYAEILSQARGEKVVIPDDFFKDKIIVIGTTALGLHDFRSTPINENYPGVFILSTAIDNLISGDGLTKIDERLFNFIGSMLFILIAVISIRCGLWVGIAIAITCIPALILFSWYSALTGTLVDVLVTCISLTTFVVGAFLVLYLGHRRELAETVSVFNRFMDPNIVKKLLSEDDSEDLLGSKSVEVTMLFSDIRNFTSISEQRTPGEMVSLLNHYFDRQVKTLFRYHATLDKFIGDAVMAFWGAPLVHEEHPIYAINAALDMIDNLEIFKSEYGYKDFDIGIGIHTGYAVVGMVGAQQRYDYTVIGDTVNLASRIEGLTKNCAQILVSETTMKVAKDHFDFIPRGEFQVKGRNEAVRVYEPKRKI